MDDWPIIEESRFPEAPDPVGFVDTFEQLDGRWVSPSVSPMSFAQVRDGLTLSAGRTPDEAEQRRVLCTRATAREWSASAAITEGDAALPVGASLALRSRADNAHHVGGVGPDMVEAGYEDAGQFTVIASCDGRYVSTEIAGGFTGRMVGLEALGGSARCGEFAYRVVRP